MATVNQTINNLKGALGNINAVIDTLENGLPEKVVEVEKIEHYCARCDLHISNHRHLDCQHNWYVSYLPMTDVLIISCSNCQLHIEDDALKGMLKQVFVSDEVRV